MAAEYITDNVIIGNGEIPAVRTPDGIEYILPGGRRTKCRECAETWAAKLDVEIGANLHQFKRKLLRG